MTDSTLANLPSASTLDGTETLYAVQGEADKKATAAQLKAFAKAGLAKTDVGLGNVDNTADSAKPVSTATQTALDAKADASATTTALAGKVAIASVGQANGVAGLDSGGKIPEAQLPAVAITDVFAVADQASMLALTAQRGDVAVRSDLNKSFVLSTNSPGTLGDWIELRTPTDAVLSVAGRTGAVTLAAADVSDSTAAGRSLLTAANAAAQKAALSLAKADVGLGSVDNTADASKPVSTAQATAIAAKEDIGSYTAGINTQTGTSYTLAASDVGKLVEMNNASANTITVPLNSAVAIGVGKRIDIEQYGAGQTSIAVAAGVTIRSSGGKLKLAGQYSGATLFKRATDEWVLLGDIIA